MDAHEKDDPKGTPPGKYPAEEPNKELPSSNKLPSPAPDKPANGLVKRSPSIWARLLRGLLGILILLGIGALAVVLLLYLPIRQELNQARNKIESLTAQSSTEMETANQEIERLSSFETSNKDLQAQLDETTLLLTIKQVQLDISTARLTLANEDPAKPSWP